MQSTIPNVDLELIRRQFDQMTNDLNLASSRSGSRGPDTRELCKCTQGFVQLMDDITRDYGTHPQHIVGQHVCCNTVIMILEYAVKPAFAHYCATTASKSLLAAQQLVLQRHNATSSTVIKTMHGEALLLPNAEGPRQAKKAQQLREDIVRPFVDLILALHRALPLEPLTDGVQAWGRRRAGSGDAVDAPPDSAVSADRATTTSASGAAAAELPASLSAVADPLADNAASGLGGGGGGAAGQRRLADVFGMSAIMTPQFTTTQLPSTAPLLWKHGEPLRLITQHALEVLESEVLSAVIGQEYAGLLTNLLALDGYARVLPSLFVRSLVDRVLTLVERVETRETTNGGAVLTAATAETSQVTQAAAQAMPPSLSSSPSMPLLFAVSCDEGVVYNRLLLSVFAMPQFTSSFRAMYQLDSRSDRPTTSATHDPASIELVMRRLCRAVRHWHQNPSSAMTLEATALHALTHLVRLTEHDYPTVADEPLELLKSLCNATYRAETRRKDHWRLHAFDCITQQVCHQFASVLSRQVPEDIHASFLGRPPARAAAGDAHPEATDGVTRSVSPRAVLLLHETVVPMVLQLFGQRQHEYGFMSRRDLFFFPCSAVQEVLELGAVVLYAATCTHAEYRRERQTIDEAGNRGGAHAAPQSAAHHLADTLATPADAQHTLAGSLHALRAQRAGNDTSEPPESRVLRGLRAAFGGEADPPSLERSPLASLSAIPAWLLRACGAATAAATTTATTGSSVSAHGAASAGAGGLLHVASLSDAALFYLHLLAQPCTTLHWSTDACDALVVSHLCPLFALFGERLGRLLTAALVATVMRCSPLVQQRVLLWVISHAVPRVAAVDDRADRGEVAPAEMGRVLSTSGLASGGGAHAQLAPLPHWYRLLSVLLDRAVLGGWSALLPRLPLRHLFLQGLSTVTTATMHGATSRAAVTENITHALAAVRHALVPWSRLVQEERQTLGQGSHYRFVTTQVEMAIQTREAHVAQQWRRLTGQARRASTTISSTGLRAGEPEDDDVSDAGDSTWPGHARRRPSPTPAGGGSSLLANAAASSGTPLAVLNDAMRAATSLSTLLSPAQMLLMTRVLAATEVLVSRPRRHDGALSEAAFDDDEAAEVALARCLTFAERQEDDTHRAAPGRDMDEEVQGAAAPTTTMEVARESTTPAAAAVLTYIETSLDQLGAAHDSQLDGVLADSDALPPLHVTLQCLHDAFAHACCAFGPVRGDGESRQLLEHAQRRKSALTNPSSLTRGAATPSAVLLGATSFNARRNENSAITHSSGGGSAEAAVNGLSALLSGGTTTNAMSSIAASSSSAAITSAGLARQHAWETWTSLLNEAENYVTLAVSRACGGGGAVSSVSSVPSSSSLPSQVSAGAHRWLHQTLLDRYTQPPRCVPPSLAHAAEGHWLLRYPVGSSVAIGGRAVASGDAVGESGDDAGQPDGSATTTTAAVRSADDDSFSVFVPRLWLTSPAVVNVLSDTAVRTFLRFVRRVRLAGEELQLFERCQPVARSTRHRATETAAAEHGASAPLHAGEADPVAAEASAQLHALLCIQGTQLVQWLLRLYRHGLWAPPGAHVEDDGSDAPAPSHGTSAAASTGFTSDAQDVHVFRTTDAASWFAQPEATLERLTASGRLYLAVLWVVRFLHIQLGDQHPDDAHHRTRVTPLATRGPANLTLISSRSALMALLHLFQDVGDVFLHTRFACADPGQTVVAFSGSLARRLLRDGIHQLVRHWRPADVLAQDVFLPVMETAQLSLRLLMTIMWTMQRTRVAESASDPLVDPTAVADIILDVLAFDTLVACAAPTQQQQQHQQQQRASTTNVHERKPFVPFTLPLLEPMLQMLLLLRFDFNSRAARDAYWQIIQTLYARYAAATAPTLFRVIGSTPPLFLSAALAPATRDVSAPLSSGRDARARRLLHFGASHNIARDGALLQWLVHLVEGRDPMSRTSVGGAAAAAAGGSDMSSLPVLSPAPVPSNAPLTPPLECAVLSATFRLLPLCPEALSASLGRHTFDSLSADAVYSVRRHTAKQVHVLFRLFTTRGDHVLHDLLRVCRGGILSSNPLLCATSLLALAEAAQSAPWLEPRIVYTLLECWATRGFCFRGQLLECLQTIAEGGTRRASPFNPLNDNEALDDDALTALGDDGTGARFLCAAESPSSSSTRLTGGGLRGDGQTWLAQLLKRQRSAAEDGDDGTSGGGRDRPRAHATSENKDRQAPESDPVHLAHGAKRSREEGPSGTEQVLALSSRVSSTTRTATPPPLLLLPAFAAVCQSYTRVLLFRWLWVHRHALDALPYLCFGATSLEQLAWQQAPMLLTLSLMLSSPDTSKSGGGHPPLLPRTGGPSDGAGGAVLDVLTRAVTRAWNDLHPREADSADVDASSSSPSLAASKQRRTEGDPAAPAPAPSDVTLRLLVLCFAPLVAQLVLLAAAHQPLNTRGAPHDAGDALLGLGETGGVARGLPRRGHHGSNAEVLSLHTGGDDDDTASAALSAAAEAALYWLQTILNEELAEPARFARVLRDVRPELCDDGHEPHGGATRAADGASPFLSLLWLESDRVLCCMMDLYSEEATAPQTGLAGLERGVERVADWLWSAAPRRHERRAEGKPHAGTPSTTKKSTRRGRASAAAADDALTEPVSERTEELLLRQVLHGSSSGALSPDDASATGSDGARPRLRLTQHWLRRDGGDAACTLLRYIASRTLTPPTGAQSLASAICLPRSFFGTSTATLGCVSARTDWGPTRWSSRTFFRASSLEDRQRLFCHVATQWLSPALLRCPPVLQCALTVVLGWLRRPAARTSWSDEALESLRTLACDVLLRVWPTVVSLTTATTMMPATEARVLLLQSLDSAIATTLMALSHTSPVVASTWTVLCRVDSLLRSWDWQRLGVSYAATGRSAGADDDNTSLTSSSSSIAETASDEEVEGVHNNEAVIVIDDDGGTAAPSTRQERGHHRAKRSSSSPRPRQTSVAARAIPARRRRDAVSVVLSLLQRLPFVVEAGGAPAARYLRELAYAVDTHRTTLASVLEHTAHPPPPPPAGPSSRTSRHRHGSAKDDERVAWATQTRLVLTQSLHYLFHASVQQTSSATAVAANTRLGSTLHDPARTDTSSTLPTLDDDDDDDDALGNHFTARTVVRTDTSSASTAVALFDLLRGLSWCFLEAGEGRLLERTLVQQSSQSAAWTVMRRLMLYTTLRAPEAERGLAAGSPSATASQLAALATHSPSLLSSAPQLTAEPSATSTTTGPARAVALPHCPHDILRLHHDAGQPLTAALEEIAGMHYMQILETLLDLTEAPGAVTAALAARALRRCLSLDDAPSTLDAATSEAAPGSAADEAHCASDEEAPQPPPPCDDATTSGAAVDRRLSLALRARTARACTTVDALLLFLARHTVYRYCALSAAANPQDVTDAATSTQPAPHACAAPLAEVLHRWRYYPFRRHTTLETALLPSLLPDRGVFDAIVGADAATAGAGRGRATAAATSASSTLVSSSPLPRTATARATTAGNTLASSSTGRGGPAPSPLHVLDESLWQELALFDCEWTFLPLFVLALIETYRLDEKVHILEAVKPLLRAEAVAAAAESVVALQWGVDGRHGEASFGDVARTATADMAAPPTREDTDVSGSDEDEAPLPVPAPSRSAQLRARRRQLRGSDTAQVPFWLCAVMCDDTAGLASPLGRDAPLRVNAALAGDLQCGKADRDASSGSPLLSATLLPVVFLHLMLQVESAAARALRLRWSARLDTHLVSQPQRYAFTTRLLLRTLYEGCYSPLSLSVKTTGLRGFRPPKGVPEATGDASLGQPHVSLLGTLPVLTTMREVYWLSDIPALHLAYAATVAKEPYLAALFAELSGESLLTVDVRVPRASGESRTEAEALRTAANASASAASVSDVVILTRTDAKAVAVTGGGDVEEVNGGLPVTLAVLTGVDGRRGEVLWQRNPSTASAVPLPAPSALFPSRTARGVNAASHTGGKTNTMQTSSKSRTARAEARNAELQARLYQLRELLLPVFVVAQSRLPTALEGRSALARQQVWHAHAALNGMTVAGATDRAPVTSVYDVARFWSLPTSSAAANGMATSRRDGACREDARACVMHTYALIAARERLRSSLSSTLSAQHGRVDSHEDGATSGAADLLDAPAVRGGDCGSVLRQLDATTHQLVTMAQPNIDDGASLPPLMTTGPQRRGQDGPAALEASVTIAKAAALIRAGLFNSAEEVLSGALASLNAPTSAASLWSNAGSPGGVRSRGLRAVDEAGASLRAHLAEAAWRCATWQAPHLTPDVLLYYAQTHTPRGATTAVMAEKEEQAARDGERSRGQHDASRRVQSRQAQPVDPAQQHTARALLTSLCGLREDDLSFVGGRDPPESATTSGAALSPVPERVLCQLGLSRQQHQRDAALADGAHGPDLTVAAAATTAPGSYQEAVLSALLATARGTTSEGASACAHLTTRPAPVLAAAAVRAGMTALLSRLRPSTWLASMVAAEALKDIDGFARFHQQHLVEATTASHERTTQPPRWLEPVLAWQSAEKKTGETTSHTPAGPNTALSSRNRPRAPLPLEAGLLDAVRLALCQLSGLPHWWRAYAQDRSRRAVMQTDSPPLAHRWLQDLDVSFRAQQSRLAHCALRFAAGQGGTRCEQGVTSLAAEGLVHYAESLSLTEGERTDLTLTHAQALYDMGSRGEAIALLQGVASEGTRLPFTLPMAPATPGASSSSATASSAAVEALLNLVGANAAAERQRTSLFQLPASASSDPRVVHRLMTWLHVNAVTPLSQLVRDSYFTRCAVYDTTGNCSFLLARLCHELARDIAARVRTYDFKKMQASLDDSRAQHRALVAQHERLLNAGQLSDSEKRVLHLRIKNLQGDIEQEEREVLTEVRDYHLYRRSALNSYARYLQVTTECGDRDVHAVFGLAELWFQSEERASGSTLLLEEDDDDDEGNGGDAVDGNHHTAARSTGDGKESGRRSDASNNRRGDKSKHSAHITTEVLHKALTLTPTFRFLPLYSQLTARLSGGRHLPSTTLSTAASAEMGSRNATRLYHLVARIALAHPLYTVWPLLALAHGETFVASAGALHHTDPGKVAAAKRILSDVQGSGGADETEDRRRTATYIQEARALSAAYHELAAHKVASTTSRAHRIAPDFQIIERIHDLSIPLPTVSLPTHTNAATSDAELCTLLPRIHRFHDRFTTPGGVNVPKVLVCVLSNGQSVRQLLKANDDTRQDALIEQVFALANVLFLRGEVRRDSDEAATARSVDVGDHITAATSAVGSGGVHAKPALSVRTYNVVPLSPSTGVIEWVDETVPFGEYLAGRYGNPHCTPGAHERYFPHEISSWDCRKHLERAGRRDRAARERALTDLYAAHSPAMHYYFAEHFFSVHDWLTAQQTYVRSVAASSLTGFAVGLGDRHGSNLLLHKHTGELVHIDLGIAFDQSRLLPVPEMVPFRLTRNVVDGFGVRGIDGGFRERCEEAMTVLRARRGLLLAVLESFLYDPIAKWSVVARPLDDDDATAGGVRTNAGKEGPRHPRGDDATSAETGANAAVHGQRKLMRTASTSSGDAQRTLARVEAKLKGYDGGEQLRVPAHVQKLIQSAQSIANLSAMFEGWSPWL